MPRPIRILPRTLVHSVLLSASALAAARRTVVDARESVSGGDAIIALPANGAKTHIRLLGTDTPCSAH